MATMPSALPMTGATFQFQVGEPQHHGAERVDDLNRITLAATCEALPACRSRGVTLVVTLAAESIEIRADSSGLERAVAFLLDDATALATTTGLGARVRVQTKLQERQAVLSVITAGVMGMVAAPSLPRAQWTVEAHGGVLLVMEEPDKTTYQAILPLVVPTEGNLEDRISAPSAPFIEPRMLPDTQRTPPVIDREEYLSLTPRDPSKS